MRIQESCVGMGALWREAREERGDGRPAEETVVG